jgi:GAF domain-containing protein
MQDMTAKQAQIEEILHQSQERYWSLYEWERKTREVLQVIRQSLAMDQVFPVAIEEMAKTIQANRAFIVEFNEDNAVCPVRYEYRSHPSVKPFKGIVPPWDFCPYLAISARNEMAYSFDTYNDTSVTSNAQWEQFSRQYDIQSIVVAPILYKKRLMNVLVFHTIQPRVWNEQELFFIKALSEHLSSVFYQEKQRQEFLLVLKSKLQMLSLLNQECQAPFRTIIDFAKEREVRMMPEDGNQVSGATLQKIAANADRWLKMLDTIHALSSRKFWHEQFLEPPIS